MGETSATLEIEVKFLAASLSDVRDRLVSAGATLTHPRVYERNIRFDNTRDGLQHQGKLLRLRQDRRARLTYKGIPANAAPSEARVMEELEIDVSDFNTTQAILERAGFEPRQVYEKYRETYVLKDVEIVLDEMPFGDFVELEGEENEIRELSADLGFDWEQRILANYLNLMAQLKAHHGLTFDDLTFENFRDREHSVKDILP